MAKEIFSVSDGVVIYIVNGKPGDTPSHGGTGKLGIIVIYDEENDISHRYIHCKANSPYISISGAKSKVTKGQTIAIMGNTGTGPIHLHYEPHKGKTIGIDESSYPGIDPLILFPELLISMDRDPRNHGKSPTPRTMEESKAEGKLFSQRYITTNFRGEGDTYGAGGTRVNILQTAYFICKQRGLEDKIPQVTKQVMQEAGINLDTYEGPPPTSIPSTPPSLEVLPSERLLVMVGDRNMPSSDLETFTFDGDFKVENSDITGIWENIKFFDSEDLGSGAQVATETSVIEYIKATKIEKNIKETFLVGVGLGGQVVTKILRSFNGIDKVGLIDPIPYYKFTKNLDLSPANIPQKINSIMYYGSDLNRPFSESHWNVIKNSGLFTTEVMLDDAWDEATDSLIPKSIPVEYVWFDTMVYFFKRYGGKVDSDLTLPPPPIYPFPNATEGNKFRNWVNDEKTTAEIEAIYPDPEFASDKTLGRSGTYTGRYVEQAWDVWGAEYEATL